MKSKNSHRADGRRFTISTIRARGAVIGQKVQYVLGLSLAAVIIAFAIVYFVYFR
jgi:hypothetical protein